MIRYTTESGATYTVEDGVTVYKGSHGEYTIRSEPVGIDVDAALATSRAAIRTLMAQNKAPEVGLSLAIQDINHWRISTKVVSIEYTPEMYPEGPNGELYAK